MGSKLRRFVGDRGRRVVGAQQSNLPAVATLARAGVTGLSKGSARGMPGFFAGASL